MPMKPSTTIVDTTTRPTSSSITFSILSTFAIQTAARRRQQFVDQASAQVGVPAQALAWELALLVVADHARTAVLPPHGDGGGHRALDLSRSASLNGIQPGCARTAAQPCAP